MCPPATVPMADLSIHCTNEELFTSLAKMNLGCPLPRNVITDVDPFFSKPENLPVDVWYFLNLKENRVTEYGFWRPIAEPLRIFSDVSNYGWESKHEYYEGQAPDCCKTEWLILEYKEARSLCKVSHNNDRLPDQGVEQVIDNKSNYIESSNHSNETALPTANKDSEEGSVSGELQVPDYLDRVLNDILDGKEAADYFADGDYLELLDLDAPLSPSSSENSSCLSMSSGACFDALALLLDLEAGDDQNPEKKNADMIFSVSDSSQPLNNAVAANLELPVEESFVEHDAKDEKAASSKGDPSSSAPSAGSSSSSHSSNASSSSGSHCHDAGPSSSRRPPSPDGKSRDRGSKRLKRFTKNLFCFMAF